MDKFNWKVGDLFIKCKICEICKKEKDLFIEEDSKICKECYRELSTKASNEWTIEKDKLEKIRKHKDGNEI